MTGKNLVPHQRPVAELIKTAKTLYEKAEQAAGKAEQLYISLGLTLKELKDRKPDGVTWPDYLAKHLPKIGRSRSYELLQLAEGKTTVAETRAEKRESMAKSRANRPQRGGQSEKKDKAEKESESKGTEKTAAKSTRPSKRGSASLASEINEMTRELSGFVDDYVASAETWFKDHPKADEEARASFIQFLHTNANSLLRLAQSLDGR